MSYDVTTTSLSRADRREHPRPTGARSRDADARATTARTSRSPRPTAARRSSGTRRASARTHPRPPPRAPTASIAIACTVFPSPMSSARIPPSRRSPSIRSHPCPRSWNGNSECVIAAGVGSGWKCRSSPPCNRSSSISSSDTSPSSRPASSVSSPDTARTRSTIPAPLRRCLEEPQRLLDVRTLHRMPACRRSARTDRST